MGEIPIIKLPAINWRRLFFGTLLLSIQSTFGQPNIPKFESFQSINQRTGASPSINANPSQPINSLLSNDPYKDQNYRAMQQGGMTVPGPTNNRRRSVEDERTTSNEERGQAAIGINELRLKLFQNNFLQYLHLNPDSFSLTRAVYLSESGFYENQTRPTYEQFESSIKSAARIVKQILNREGLDENDGMAVNYSIQKLYTQQNEYFDSTTGKSFLINRLHYDWDDYLGDKDWTKMFVSKLLQTGSGQCHSLPLFYLCLAEQFHAKAYLSLAPNHSFIQYFDKTGKRYNFEATNGNLVTQTWLMQSTYVNATALKNKTYLDTLSSRRLYAQCLSDLLLCYLMKTKHYDNFSEQITKRIFEIDSLNMTALMEQANRVYTIYIKECNAAGNPPPDRYSSYPKLSAAYQTLQDCERKVEQTGFQEMPKEAYQQWLQSLELEKRKEENRREQEKMKQEINRLKKINSRIIPRKKG